MHRNGNRQGGVIISGDNDPTDGGKKMGHRSYMVVIVLILEEAVCGETVDACGTTVRRHDGDLEAPSEGSA